MEVSKGTREVARQLGIRPTAILVGIYNGRIIPPPKAANGRYLWRPKDVAELRRVMVGETEVQTAKAG